MKVDKLIILVGACLLLSCSEKKENPPREQVEASLGQFGAQEEAFTILKDSVNVDSFDELASQQSVVKITFEEFVLEIDSLEVWDEEGVLKEPQKDTARVYIELGEKIEGRVLRIIQQKEGELRLYQRYENSVTVMDEGPHCDLTEWKHFDSEWQELRVRDGDFVTNTYSEQDRERFITVDMKELTEVVRKECGDRWADHILEVKAPTEYPCGVSTSRIFLKIHLSNQDTGEVIERIISFEIPMGC